MNEFAAKHEQYIRSLYRLGAFNVYATIDECLSLIDLPTFNRGVAEFTRATGQEATEEAVANVQPFCGLPAIAPFRGGICKWPQPGISFHTVGALGSISAADFRACAVMTTGWWAEVCGIRPAWTDNSKTANIVMYAKRIDGPQGVLAQMQLPCGANAASQMEGQFDLERLVIDAAPPAGQLDLARIMCHELGHALGSDHIGAGNLLAPTYDPRIRKPQPGDVAEMVKRYGPPSAAPSPTPPPVPPSGLRRMSFDIDDAGRILNPVVPGYTLLRG